MAVLAIVAGLAAQLLCGALPGASRDAVRKTQDDLRRVCDLRWQDLQAIIAQVDDDDLVAQRKQEGKTLIRQIRSLQTQLSNAPREVQLKAFLEKFPLQKDSVSGIGQSRITQLASFGIESAGDIDRDAILAVPGFGPQLADRLCTWRDDLKRRFRFNPASPMRPGDIRRFERDLKKPLEHFQNELKKSVRQAQVQEKRLAAMAARLSAHDGAVTAAVAAAAVAEINHRAGRLLPALGT
jgi:DNA-binding helix-hairpin-helix protein with protein kinase domain